MTYSEFCSAIGSDRTYPDAEVLYNTANESGELEKPVRTDLIPRYFPKIKDELISVAKEFEKDSLAVRYMNFLRVAYFKLKDSEIPFLQPEEGNLMKNFGAVFSVLEHTVSTEKEIEKRGIDEVVAEKVRTAFERALLAYKKVFGFYAVKENIYFWDRHYLIPDLFPIDTLEFEVTKMPDEGTYFKNKSTGEITVLSNVTENETSYHANTVKDGGVDGETVELSKEKYECCLAPGDPVISVHIPGGTKLDSESCNNTYKKALEFIKKAYPEKKFKGMYVRSWLMNPTLSEILGENSNILSFQSFYKRFPIKSMGDEVFGFVFPKPIERYEDIPETTSLYRGLKKRYLDENRPVYVYAGIHLFAEDK